MSDPSVEEEVLAIARIEHALDLLGAGEAQQAARVALDTLRHSLGFIEIGRTEERPYPKGERVYLLWPEGSQPPGTTCDVGLVFEDDGGERVLVLLPGMPMLSLDRGRVRRDRRGRNGPVYPEVPFHG